MLERRRPGATVVLDHLVPRKAAAVADWLAQAWPRPECHHRPRRPELVPALRLGAKLTQHPH